MIFKNVKNINIPEGVVVKIATALDGIILWQKETEMPTDEIWYTSTDGNIVTPSTSKTILSNTYEDGIGKLKIEGDLSNFDISFSYSKTLKTIILPEGIITINTNFHVFQGCSNLEEVTLPDSLTTLGNYTFDSCTSLKSIVIPKNVRSLGGENTFNNCSNLESVIIEGLTINGVGYKAFTSCKKLSSIDTSKVVKSYGSYGFQRCNPSVLPQIVINENVSSIGYQVFPYNVNIISNSNRFIIENDLLIDLQNNKIIQGLKNINGHVYNIPNYITTVGGEAFYDCSSLKSMVLPEGVSTIDGKAFYSAYNLTTVDFPSTLLSVNYECFNNTYKLNTIISRAKIAPSLYRSSALGWISFDNAGKDVAEGEKIIYIHQNADYESYTTGEWKTQLLDKGWQIRFIEGEEPEQPNNEIWYTSTDGKIFIAPTITGNDLISNTYEDGVGKLVYQNEITTLENNMFTENNKLKTITIPNSVTAINYHAFFKCSSLESITIPDSVTSLGEGAFLSCTTLKDITIPDSVTSLASGVCANCTSLETITLSKNISKIEDYSFRDTYKLKTIIAPALVAPSCMNTAFLNVGTEVEGDKILYIYKEATGYEAWLELLPGFSIQYITE